MFTDTEGDEVGDGKMWLMSCDIGKRNFAVSICEYDLSILHSLKKLDKPLDIIEGVVRSHRIVMMDLTDFIGAPNVLLSQDIYVNITRYMASIKWWLDRCTCFIIEKQMKTNPEATCIEQHIYSYLVITYELSKEVVKFPSRLKYLEMNFPRNIKKKYYRKKWGVDTIRGVLEGNCRAITYIFDTHKTKKDDLADTLLQSYAFCRRTFVHQVI